MDSTKPFYIFVALLAAAGVAFGFYVSGLTSCKDLAPATGAFTQGDCHKLYLAFGVLFAVAVMLALGAAFYALLPPPSTGTKNPGEQIFDAFTKILPPIVTLVLGYYFGSTNGGQTQPSEPKTQVTTGAQTKTDPKTDQKQSTTTSIGTAPEPSASMPKKP